MHVTCTAHHAAGWDRETQASEATVEGHGDQCVWLEASQRGEVGLRAKEEPKCTRG